MTYSKLFEGAFTLDSDILGKWRIEKSDSFVTVEPYCGDAEIKLEGDTVYSFLFGTKKPFLGKNISDKTASLIGSWLPLPLYCPYLS